MAAGLERFERVDSLLRRCFDLEASERAAFLEEACGSDLSLLDEVERLRRHCEEDPSLDPLTLLDSHWRRLAGERSGVSERPLVGQTLGHYRVLRALGQGGMGEVFLAEDSNLKRRVALKVIRSGLADSPERASRFRREARLLAAVTHPNIAEVHGFEEASGVRFLVMEFVEGETLGDRLARGPVSVDEAVSIASQVAHALQAAHRSGIIHRDLKPANVQLRSGLNPVVKVLDFGLAKSLSSPHSDGQAEDVSGSPTLTRVSREGSLMGTALYMSPEQARGQEADERSDLWALGCVLYEMLVGASAFRGDTVSDVLAAVLREDPDTSRLPREVPLQVKRALERCFRKDPEKRWHHAADFRLALEDDDHIAATPPDRPGLGIGRASALGASLLLGGLILGALWGSRDSERWRGPAQVTPLRAALDAPRPNFGSALWHPSVAISPNGRRMAVAGGGLIHIRHQFENDWRELRGTEGGSWPRFTADGERLIFWRQGKSEVVPAEGGSVQRLRSGSRELELASLAGGEALYFDGERRLWSVLSGGNERTVVRCDDVPLACEVSPNRAVLLGGDTILACESRADGAALYRLESTGASQVLDDACFPKRVGERLFFRRQGELWATTLDGDGTLVGPGVPTGVHTYQYNSIHGRPHFDVSESGTLIYFEATPESGLWRVDSQGRMRSQLRLDRPIPAGSTVEITVSPDGRHALLVAGRAVRVVSLEGAGETRAVPGDHAAWFDSSTFFVSDAWGGPLREFDLEVRLVAEHVVTLPGDTAFEGWSRVDAAHAPSNTFIVNTWFEVEGTSDGKLYQIDLAGERPPRRLPLPPHGLRWSSFSSDGDWIVWEKSSDPIQINASRWPDDMAVVPVSTNGGEQPQWSHAGDKIYFLDARREFMMVADFNPRERPAFTAPRRLFRLPENMVRSQDVSYDSIPGGDLLMAITHRPIRHRIVVNWLAEVDELLAEASG